MMTNWTTPVSTGSLSSCVMEQVQILDESTGQIVIREQERVDDFFIEHDYNDDDDMMLMSNTSALDSHQAIAESFDETTIARNGDERSSSDNDNDNQLEMSVDEVDTCRIAFPHFSIISQREANQLKPIEVKTTIDEKTTVFYRCPMCCPNRPESAYCNLLASKCVDHMKSNKHLSASSSIQHKQWLICKCEDTTCFDQALVDENNNINTNTNASTNVDDQSTTISDTSYSSNSTSSTSSLSFLSTDDATVYAAKSKQQAISAKVHYHCPHCSNIFFKRNHLRIHIDECCQKHASDNGVNIDSHANYKRSATSQTSVIDRSRQPTSPHMSHLDSQQRHESNKSSFNLIFLDDSPAPANSIQQSQSVQPPASIMQQEHLHQHHHNQTENAINTMKMPLKHTLDFTTANQLTNTTPTHSATSTTINANNSTPINSTNYINSNSSSSLTFEMPHVSQSQSMIQQPVIAQQQPTQPMSSSSSSSSSSPSTKIIKLINPNDLYQQRITLNSLRTSSRCHLTTKSTTSSFESSYTFVDNQSQQQTTLGSHSPQSNTNSYVIQSKNDESTNVSKTTRLSSSASVPSLLPQARSYRTNRTSNLPAHIVQNYSILAQEITAPLVTATTTSENRACHSNQESVVGSPVSNSGYHDYERDYSSMLKQWHTAAVEQRSSKLRKSSTSNGIEVSKRRKTKSNGTSYKTKSNTETATCQFCGCKMLKKNILTHIRRAHTPKEELVCLDEEQNIFTFQHLKPGERRKRSARAYDYSLMTATVSIDDEDEEEDIIAMSDVTHNHMTATVANLNGDDDADENTMNSLNASENINNINDNSNGDSHNQNERSNGSNSSNHQLDQWRSRRRFGIEKKFITEGAEILSTDLVKLNDRIKYGVSQIEASVLVKLVDVLTKIEYSNQEEQSICTSAKSIRNMIECYLRSDNEFKLTLSRVSSEVAEKKRYVSRLRSELKDVMAKKAQLERRIQPMVCELQRLEDEHCNLIVESTNAFHRSNDHQLV